MGRGDRCRCGLGRARHCPGGRRGSGGANAIGRGSGARHCRGGSCRLCRSIFVVVKKRAGEQQGCCFPRRRQTCGGALHSHSFSPGEWAECRTDSPPIHCRRPQSERPTKRHGQTRDQTVDASFNIALTIGFLWLTVDKDRGNFLMLRGGVLECRPLPLPARTGQSWRQRGCSQMQNIPNMKRLKRFNLARNRPMINES